MSMTGKRAHTHILPADAGIRNAAEVAGSLMKALDNHNAVSVETKTLATADITTVQTLLAARISAEARGKTLTLLSPVGEPLRAVLRDAGLLSTAQIHAAFWAPSSEQS